jgi:hypothetical protein
MQTSSTNQSAIVPLRQIESDEHDAMSAQHAVVSVVLEVQLMLSGCIMMPQDASVGGRSLDRAHPLAPARDSTTLVLISMS